jgi:hypothetical protein
MLKMKILICAVLLIAAEPLASKIELEAFQGNVTLSGTAKTCFNTTAVPVAGVSVSFFKVSSARPIVAHLDSMNTFSGFGHGDDETASGQFDAMETAMQSMIVSTPAILRRTSAADGTFAITISAVDSVVAVGYANMEDEPFVYDYKIMPGIADRSFILDMSRGQCGF